VTVPLEDLPPVAQRAWTRLRDEVSAILGGDLVAMWGYGGTTFPDRSRRPGDLDTIVVVRAEPDEGAAERLRRAEADVAKDEGIDWDVWYLLESDARRGEPPPDVLDPEDRLTSWAIDRAHWLAGACVPLAGPPPERIVPPPAWEEIETALDRELEHLERHVAEGDDDPVEATYAVGNGSRILRAVETRDVAVSKRGGGRWALEHLPERWHAVIHAAARASDGEATPEDEAALREAMAPFVAMVRERLPRSRPEGEPPRWSGE
jgi:hypothetical protein